MSNLVFNLLGILCVAQFAPASDSISVGQVFLYASGLASIGAVIMFPIMLRHYSDRQPKREIHPQPLQIQNVKDLATVSQLDAVERQFDKRLDKLQERTDAQFGDVFKTIGNEGRRVDSRINDVLTAVSNLRGAFDQSQRRKASNHD